MVGWMPSTWKAPQRGVRLPSAACCSSEREGWSPVHRPTGAGRPGHYHSSPSFSRYPSSRQWPKLCHFPGAASRGAGRGGEEGEGPAACLPRARAPSCARRAGNAWLEPSGKIICSRPLRKVGALLGGDFWNNAGV